MTSRLRTANETTSWERIVRSEGGNGLAADP